MDVENPMVIDSLWEKDSEQEILDREEFERKLDDMRYDDMR